MPRIVLIPTHDPLPQTDDIATRLRAAFFGSGEVVSGTDPTLLDRADAVVILLHPAGLAALADHPAVADALARSELLVVVALLDGASVPAPTALPPHLSALAYLTQVPVRAGAPYESDLNALAAPLLNHFRRVEAGQPSRAAASGHSGIPWNLVIIGLALVAGLALLALSQVNSPTGGTSAQSASAPADSTEPPGSIASGGQVVIGLAADFSQDLAQGETLLRGAELALQDRPLVTIDGRSFGVRLLTQDAGCSAFAGLQAAELFAADPDVVGVIGHQCSTSCAAAVGVYDRARFTTLSPACTDPALTDQESASFNRVVPSAAYVAVGAAAYAQQALEVARVAVVYDELLLGTEIAAAFYGASSSVTGYYGILSAETDFAELAARVLTDDPQGVFAAGRPSTAAALRAALPPDLPFFYGGGTLTPADVTDFIAQAGAAAEGVYVFAAQPAYTPAYADLAAAYARAYGEEPTSPVFAFAYDAANVLLDAIEATAQVDPNGGLRLDRMRLAAAVRAYRGAGVTGPLACDGRGNCAAVPVAVQQIQSGAVVEVAVQPAPAAP